MMEKAPKYRATFKPVPRSVGLLGGDMAPYTNADITNPRELYAMLSQSRGHQGAVLTSVRVNNSQAGAKLPPLDSSLEAQFRSLARHPQHSSYPDLASCRSDNGAHHPYHPHHPHHSDSLRRSSSLQELRSMGLSVEGGDGVVAHTKKLKPILRGTKTKNASEKAGGVKFGEKEVHLIRDSPLPPIEGKAGKESSGKGGLSVSSAALDEDEDKAGRALSSSPRHHKRHGAEFSSDIFPRGQPVEVKKPATPTYNDYPEVYWELRSPTVQDPSDLKEDMIDRDRYRLKQISSLRLKAMNRELAASKLDSYRKWQQQLLAVSPPVGGAGSKQDSAARGSVTPSMTGPAPSAKPGKQQKTSSSLQTDTLAVAATSISPNANPAIKRRMDTSRSVVPEHRHISDGYVTDDELRRRQKIDAAARGENGAPEPEGKPFRAAVVNLCMDPDRSSNSPTSDVYMGIRRIMFGPRPPSVKSRTQTSVHDQDQQGEDNSPKPPGSVSVASVNATLGSSHSHRLTRVLSAPTDSAVIVDGSLAAPGGAGGDTTDTDSSSVASKKILKKFTKLQVFSEKRPAVMEEENASAAQPWGVAVRPREKGRYLPQCRPPSYKLDLRQYPTRHFHSSMARIGDDMTVIAEGGDGFPLLFHDERGAVPHLGHPSPTKSEAPSVSFQFRDGEVIVSRQSRKPDVS